MRDITALSILQQHCTQNYARLRFGIGNDFPRGGQIDYVLGHFDREEQVLMKQVSEEVCEAVQMILEKRSGCSDERV